MTAVFRDDIQFEKPLTLTAGTGQRLPKFLEVPFTAAVIAAYGLGDALVSDDLPANALILGVHVVISTAFTYSNVGTTGVSVKIGNADDDGFGLNTALAGTAGYRRPAPGALVGGVVAGGADGLIAVFTPTGGAASLAHLSAGAGKIVIDYLEV